jgi:hypothetical protein
VSVSLLSELRSRPKMLAVALATVVAGLSLSACKEVESESAAGYEPTKLEAIKGKDEESQRVTFTQEGAARVDVKTGKVTRRGRQLAVPYAALIYSGDVKTYVYVTSKPRTYERAEVKVDRIEGNRVLLSKGPRPGTEVVTRGAAEVYGAELDIAGSH